MFIGKTKKQKDQKVKKHETLKIQLQAILNNVKSVHQVTDDSASRRMVAKYLLKLSRNNEMVVVVSRNLDRLSMDIIINNVPYFINHKYDPTLEHFIIVKLEESKTSEKRKGISKIDQMLANDFWGNI